MFRDPGRLDVILQDLPRAHASEWASAGVQKQYALAFSLLESRSQLAYVRGHRADRLATDRHEAFLAALSENSNQHILEQHVLHAKRDPLGDPQSGPIRQLEHRAIAERKRLIDLRGGEQPLDLVDGQNLGQRPPALRRLEPLARILDDDAVREQKPKIGADCRDVASDRRRGEAEVLQLIDELTERTTR